MKKRDRAVFGAPPLFSFPSVVGAVDEHLRSDGQGGSTWTGSPPTTDFGTGGLSTDTISESTTSAGVTFNHPVEIGTNALTSSSTIDTIDVANHNHDGTATNGVQINSDNLTEGATQLLLTTAERTTLGDIGMSGDNTIIGIDSGTNTSSATSTTLIGNKAGEELTTGGNNTFVGAFAGEHVTAGAFCTHIGSNTGWGVGTPTGNRNTSVGAYAMATHQGVAANNTCIGYEAGYTITTGSQNTLVGDQADITTSTTTNSIAIGYQAKATAGSQCMLGNTSLLSVVPHSSASCSVGTSGNKFSDLHLSGQANINTLFKSTPTYFRGTRNTTQSFSSAFLTMQFSSTTTSGGISESSGVITVTDKGIYQITAGTEFSGTSTDKTLSVRESGGDYYPGAQSRPAGAATGRLNVSLIIELAASEAFIIEAFNGTYSGETIGGANAFQQNGVSVYMLCKT